MAASQRDSPSQVPRDMALKAYVDWGDSNYRRTVVASTLKGSAPSGGAIPHR